MSRKRKSPKLRFNGKYYVVNFYKPDGKRTMISFGPADERTEGEIYAAFGKWLDLFKQQPQKILSFESPYDAIEQVINPSQIITIGELLDKYDTYTKKTTRVTSDGKEHLRR